MKNSNHIIEKVLLEVNTSSLETAHSIRNNIDEFLKNELFPRLEMLFDEYQFHDEIIRFDEITLNLTVAKWRNFMDVQSEIYDQLKEQIESQIPAAVNGKDTLPGSHESAKNHVQRISAAENSGKVFLFFLEKGHLPWYGKEEQIKTFTRLADWEKHLDDPGFFRKLDQLLGSRELSADRFILQFPDEMIASYLRRKNLRIHAETSAVLKISKNLGHEGRHIFLKLMIRIAHDSFPGVSQAFDRLIYGVLKAERSGGPQTEIREIEQMKQLFQRILPESPLQDSVLEKIDLLVEGKDELLGAAHKIHDPGHVEHREGEKVKPGEESGHSELKPGHEAVQENLPFLENDDELHVQNAGLILLHPFFKTFFAATGIVGKQGILSPLNSDLAVQSLHFLATGNESAFEGNLVFEKFLCGVPLKMPVQKNSLLTEMSKNEADELLKEVVRNWPALKNTSTDGLRQMFIQRDGKLIQKDDKYKLIVERKAQDVLLEKLNWNISLIKLPWISKILFTEW